MFLPSAMLLCRLLFCLSLASLGVLAKKEETKVMNRTIERTVQLRTHSIFPPYIDQDLQNRWWDFGADTIINTNKHIRLTRARPSEMGWLWSRLPLTAANFVLEVEFKITGETGHLFGDGLAIWITKGRAEPGPVFGNIDEFEGLGIFLDTYANSRHSYAFPRVVAMLGDGKTKYDQEHDGDANAIGACSANFRRTNVATKLKITYIREQYLDVKIQHKAWDEWSDCFTLTGISLPSAPFVGFSALTGAVHDNHDIISVSTYSAILSPENAPRDKLRPSFFGSRNPTSSGSGSWLGFSFKIFLLAGLVAGAWYGYQMYLKKQRYGGFGGGMGLGGGSGTGGFMNGLGGMGNSVGRNAGLGGPYYDSKRF